MLRIRMKGGDVLLLVALLPEKVVLAKKAIIVTVDGGVQSSVPLATTLNQRPALVWRQGSHGKSTATGAVLQCQLPSERPALSLADLQALLEKLINDERN